ncbi:MAG: surface layer protein B [bacterium]|nr:MAG: surface layer protein B [bacterium]
MKKLSDYFCIKNRIAVIIFVSVILCCIGVFSNQNFNDQDPPLAEAPMNPKFIKYLEDHQKGEDWVTMTSDGHPLGLIPDPYDLSYLDTSYLDSQSTLDASALPKSYDLRTKNKLPPVRDQGACGSCWAFATFAAMESSLLPSQKKDFSEQHLIDKNGFKGGPCKGGSINKAVSYLVRWSGPLGEKDVPYEYDSHMDSPEPINHVQNVIYIPPRSGPKDNKKIKEAVKKYGAVYTTMYYDPDNQYYDPAHYSYYNPSVEEGSHAVAIVGWKDKFDKNKFSEIPPGNGAFIARNSWGPHWGEEGYFYVSYHDPYFASGSLNAAFKKPEAISNYKEIYEYDPSGCTIMLGYPPLEKAWFANIFKAKSDKGIKAVSFYAFGAPNKYKVYVYTNVDANAPRSGTLARKKSGKLTSMGYYTIRFNKVPLKQDERFSVVVELETKGWQYPIPVEKPVSGYTKNVKAKSGQSYISNDGESWADLPKIEGYKKTSVCLKAFTK